MVLRYFRLVEHIRKLDIDLDGDLGVMCWGLGLNYKFFMRVKKTKAISYSWEMILIRLESVDIVAWQKDIEQRNCIG